jgi:hypothetical protein
MGSGAFGSNGSVHWKIVHTADETHEGFIRGRDPNVKFNDPRKPKVDDIPKEYLVRLRFTGGKTVAKAALEDALKKLKGDESFGIAEIHVPASVEYKTRVPPDDQFEIIVRW